jgi:hypothetical protein
MRQLRLHALLLPLLVMVAAANVRTGAAVGSDPLN